MEQPPKGGAVLSESSDADDGCSGTGGLPQCGNVPSDQSVHLALAWPCSGSQGLSERGQLGRTWVAQATEIGRVDLRMAVELAHEPVHDRRIQPQAEALREFAWHA